MILVNKELNRSSNFSPFSPNTWNGHQTDTHIHQHHVFSTTTFRSGLPQLLSSQIAFDSIKAGATQTETWWLKKHDAGERMYFLDDDYDVQARTITELEWCLVNLGEKRTSFVSGFFFLFTIFPYVIQLA